MPERKIFVNEPAKFVRHNAAISAERALYQHGAKPHVCSRAKCWNTSTKITLMEIDFTELILRSALPLPDKQYKE